MGHAGERIREGEAGVWVWKMKFTAVLPGHAFPFILPIIFHKGPRGKEGWEEAAGIETNEYSSLLKIS